MGINNLFKLFGKEILIGLISSIIVSIVLKLFRVGFVYVSLVLCIICIIVLLYVCYSLKSKHLFAQKIISNTEKTILNECKKAEQINIFVMKGGLFTKQDQVLHRLFDDKYSYKQIKFLMVKPDSISVERRAKEIFDRPIEHLRQETKISLDTIMMLHSKNPNITVKVHNENAFIRFVYTENIMFFSYLVPKRYALNSPFYKVKSNSPIYVSFKKYFEDIFENKSIIPKDR